jgi:hypothetical protein
MIPFQRSVREYEGVTIQSEPCKIKVNRCRKTVNPLRSAGLSVNSAWKAAIDTLQTRRIKP